MEPPQAALARLVSCFGLDRGAQTRLVAELAELQRSPSTSLFSTPTSLLSRVLRLLKALAPAELKATIEEAFMALVSNVRYALVQSGARAHEFRAS